MKEFTKKDIKLYDRLLYVKVDTKRLKLVEYVKGKKKILLNKEQYCDLVESQQSLMKYCRV